MPWYEIINAKRDSYIADRDAEELLRQLATVLQTEDGPVEAEVFYDHTSHGARRYYLSLSRIVKIFELVFRLAVTPLPSPVLWACLQLHSHPYSASTGTAKTEGERRMDWKALLAYITDALIGFRGLMLQPCPRITLSL